MNHYGESDETKGEQFIKDRKLGECVREILDLYKAWQLRPLEEEIVTMMVDNALKKRKKQEFSQGLMKGALSKIGMMK